MQGDYENMNLQNILWPQVDVCMQEEMYFRNNEKASRLGNKFLFEKGGVIRTDTYFNSVSIDKWRKYTNAGELSVNLSLKGDFRVYLSYKKKVHNQIFEKIVMELLFQDNAEKQVALSFPQGEGMAFFRLEALRDDSEFLGGYYSVAVEEQYVRNVKLGIGICTFRRESFVEHNLQVLNKYIFENPKSDLNGHLEVFVSDNGQTLNIDKLATEKIHIVKNKNAGGAGGFTRDLIEILGANKNGAEVTHALLMDDDIIIEPEALLRTYKILSILKEEYKNSFIGGAMLRNDARNIQVESGASWNAGHLISLKSNLNMNLCDACLYNEVEEYCEYNAWWYCCFPVEVVKEDNLPMPIFIRGDDLEYGLRNMNNLILMNGICVWHEPFENKYSSFLSYYILRNQFIDNALHFPDYKKKEAKRRVRNSVIREIIYFRYKNVDLIIKGVRDFLLGIDWLLESDGEALHKAVMSAGYKAQPVEQLSIPFSYPTYEHSRVENDSRWKKLIRYSSINGYLFRPKRDNVVSMSELRPYNAYRARRLLNYDVTTHKGFVTERSWKEAIRCSLALMKVLVEMNRKYDGAAKDYRARCSEVQNIDFWRKYLGL